MVAIKNAEQLQQAVNDYMNRHGLKLKYSRYNPFDNYYNVLTTDYTQLESKVITMKNGKTRVVFKVDGKVKSLYK